MRTTRRPTQATRILTTGLAASLAMGLMLSGCGSTAEGIEDRAAGAAGGQGWRGHGGPGRATVSPPSAGRDRLSSPAAPSDSDKAEAGQRGLAGTGEVVTGHVLRGFATGPAELRHPVQDNVRDFDVDLSPANAVSAS